MYTEKESLLAIARDNYAKTKASETIKNYISARDTYLWAMERLRDYGIFAI